MRTIGIIGTGMMGCSLALACKSKTHCTIFGFDTNIDSLTQAKQLGCIDEVCVSLTDISTASDLLVLACPIEAILSTIEQLPPPRSNQWIIDLGSVKEAIVKQAEICWKDNCSQFVPCHPITGLEHSGANAANATLFDHAKVIITPSHLNPVSLIHEVQQFWKKLGAIPLILDASDHDQLMARVSHLPHALAFAFVEGLFRRCGSDVFHWSAGGFRDFTRIASSDPIMWHDICIHNKNNISQALGQLIEDLSELKQAIDHRNSASIKHIFSCAQQERNQFYSQHSMTQTTSSLKANVC